MVSTSGAFFFYSNQLEAYAIFAFHRDLVHISSPFEAWRTIRHGRSAAGCCRRVVRTCDYLDRVGINATILEINPLSIGLHRSFAISKEKL